MASKTYKARALVLHKTKLGEKDLIVEMLDESGALLKGVAKGARKPGGSLAARLELFSSVSLLMAHGRSLDVVCEARLEDALAGTLCLEQAACASPIAELLRIVAQPDLPQPRLFDMSRAAFGHIASSGDDAPRALSVTAAAIWKVMSQAGFRPSFATCISCGADCRGQGQGGQVAVSVIDGGVFCGDCRRPADAIMVDAAVLQWCEALIALRFDEVMAAGMSSQTAFQVLHLARSWARAHAGRDLKSLDFLFTSGVF